MEKGNNNSGEVRNMTGAAAAFGIGRPRVGLDAATEDLPPMR